MNSRDFDLEDPKEFSRGTIQKSFLALSFVTVFIRLLRELFKATYKTPDHVTLNKYSRPGFPTLWLSHQIDPRSCGKPLNVSKFQTVQLQYQKTCKSWRTKVGRQQVPTLEDGNCYYQSEGCIPRNSRFLGNCLPFIQS